LLKQESISAVKRHQGASNYREQRYLKQEAVM